MLNFFLSDGFNGGADSITHYHISKFSWSHHELFMDQWGKPVFNILFSPIAQLGFQAVVFSNILIIFFISWLSYKIAKGLDVKNAHWVAWLYLLTPIVIGNSISSLTEPICSLFLVIFIYFAVKDKWILASIILGFMPFARSEGFVILLLVFIFYIFSNRLKMIPFLLTGTIIFNLIGYAVTDLPLWIFQQNPYIHSDNSFYGSGPIYHFFMAAIPIFGFVFLLVLIQSYNYIKWIPTILQTKSWESKNQIWFWIITGSFWGYFLAHTFLWWQGMWASLGLLRVMFVIAVPMALLSVKCYESIEQNYKVFQNKIFKILFWIHILFLPFVIRLFPIQEIEIFPSKGQEEKTADIFVEEFKKNIPNWRDKKLFTGHPYILFKLGIDPFDKNKSAFLWDWEDATKGDLIIWDGHFGPNEHRLPKIKLDSNRTFKFLFEVEPEKEFYTLNNSKFSFRIYEKQ